MHEGTEEGAVLGHDVWLPVGEHQMMPTPLSLFFLVQLLSHFVPSFKSLSLLSFLIRKGEERQCGALHPPLSEGCSQRLSTKGIVGCPWNCPRTCQPVEALLHPTAW